MRLERAPLTKSIRGQVLPFAFSAKQAYARSKRRPDLASPLPNPVTTTTKSACLQGILLVEVTESSGDAAASEAVVGR